MGGWSSIGGRLNIRISSASLENDLYCLTQNNVVLRDLVKYDDLTAKATILRADYRRVIKCLASNTEVEIINNEGVYWTIRSIFKRPILVAGIVIYLLLLIFIPNHVFFYKVVGNSAVSTEEIIFHTQQVGLSFGVPRKQIRSERIKNELLLRIPQLQWVGVNTYGCVAVISVKEDTLPQQKQNGVVNSIVSNSDAIVEDIVINRGELKCKVGQIVLKGDLLVSGYADCGHSVKFTGADAEIYGRTKRLLRAYVPTLRWYRGKEVSKNKKYSIYFGKKLINLCNDSGIPGAECAKIYTEYCLRLPGGFVLPVGLVKETEIRYQLQQRQEDLADKIEEAKSLANHYITKTMRSGQILNASYKATTSDEKLELIGSYTCRELIGKINFEENIAEHE